ncbi:MAG: CHAT domain-containing protein [Verrucomicrobiales bacterium]|nr:CHAT domain-containing protein [Verrucomicrobiales bacterium]
MRALKQVAVALLFLHSLVLTPGFARELTQAHRERHEHCLALQQEGRWREALAVATELVSAFEGTPPSQHQLVFTNELANLNQRLGNYTGAEVEYLACIEIADAIAGPESKLVGQLKNNLAALYQVLGRFETAEKLNREALAIRESTDGKGAASTVPAMNNLAGLLWCIGDIDGAETLYRKALEIRSSQLGPESLETARSRANLGGLLFYRDQVEEAGDLVRKAVDTFTIEFGTRHPDTLEVLLFLGEIERALGRPDSAIRLYQQVRDGRAAAFGEQPHFETAEAERRLGDARRELGDYTGAIESYSRSETIYRGSLRPGHPDLIEGLYGAGLAALASGDLDLTLKKAQACSEIELSNLTAVLEFTDERQRLAYQNLFRSHHLFANLKDGTRVAEFLLQRKGVVIDSLISEARLMRRANSSEEKEAVAALENARAQFRSAFLATGGSDIDIREAQEAVRHAHRRLLEATGGTGFGSQFLEPGLSDLQETLSQGEFLVDYLYFDSYQGKANLERHIGAAIVSRDSVHFADCGPLSEVSNLIAESASFFGAAQPDDELAESILRDLYRSLFAPITSLLDDATGVFISPEGALNFVPFACLIDEQGQFLIENFDIGYVSAARELLKPSEAVDPNRGALLFGNPKFDTRHDTAETISDRRGLLSTFSAAALSEFSRALGPLPGAGKEVSQLSTLLTSLSIPARAITGTDATESRLREDAIQPYILHLATHGLYLPSMIPPPRETGTRSRFVPREITGFQNPLFGSWITLSGSSNTIESWSGGRVPSPYTDGILMANEAAELDLNGTLVVTLSACDTATGEATAGDGVLGIRRGFRIAGAEHVLSTLWPINDSMTPRIMSDFYSGLLEGTPTRSLSEAQRRWLRTIRDDPEAVSLPLSGGGELTVGGLYWAINLAGPFLLSR